MKPLSCAVVRYRLRERGFLGLTETEACRIGPWMRFTPMLQALSFALSTATGSAPALFGLAAMLMFGVATGNHPFDLAYRALIRPVEGSPDLPESPPRRRLVFVLGALWCLATAWCFSNSHDAAGALLGFLMTASTAMLAGTHICIPSRIMAWAAGRSGDSA